MRLVPLKTFSQTRRIAEHEPWLLRLSRRNMTETYPEDHYREVKQVFSYERVRTSTSYRRVGLFRHTELEIGPQHLCNHMHVSSPYGEASPGDILTANVFVGNIRQLRPVVCPPSEKAAELDRQQHSRQTRRPPDPSEKGTEQSRVDTPVDQGSEHG